MMAQGHGGTFLVNVKANYILIKVMVMRLYTICQKPSTLKCLNFIVCNYRSIKLISERKKTKSLDEVNHTSLRCVCRVGP